MKAKLGCDILHEVLEQKKYFFIKPPKNAASESHIYFDISLTSVRPVDTGAADNSLWAED